MYTKSLLYINVKKIMSGSQVMPSMVGIFPSYLKRDGSIDH